MIYDVELETKIDKRYGKVLLLVNKLLKSMYPKILTYSQKSLGTLVVSIFPLKITDSMSSQDIFLCRT